MDKNKHTIKLENIEHQLDELIKRREQLKTEIRLQKSEAKITKKPISGARNLKVPPELVVQIQLLQSKVRYLRYKVESNPQTKLQT